MAVSGLRPTAGSCALLTIQERDQDAVRDQELEEG